MRKGAPKPDITTPEAVKRLLLAAKSVSYPDPAGGAAAGVSFNETLKKLGITEQIKPTIKLAQGGAGAMAMVAKGEAEIGLTFLSEMEDPGIDVVGPLPKEISTPTTLVGFVGAHAKDPKSRQRASGFSLIAQRRGSLGATDATGALKVQILEVSVFARNPRHIIVPYMQRPTHDENLRRQAAIGYRL